MTYKELKEFLKNCSDSYYKDGISKISDFEFDQKLKELENMETEQGYRDEDSPTQRPGSDLLMLDNANTHKRPMLSLENTYDVDDVSKWFDDMRKATGEEEPEVVVNPKWDGNSGALRYNQHGLYKALTRGSGEIGEDITQNIKYCSDEIWAPKKLYGNPFIGEARGEIIMTKDSFEKINTDGKYQNARNLVAGSLKLLDIHEFIPRASAIKFYAYWLEDSECEKYSEDLALLKMYGFDVGDFYICHTLEEIKAAIDKIETTDFDVAIDGAVMKLNNKKYWNEIGSTAKFPRWAKAYKYHQEEATTTITKIEFFTSRTGKVTPVAYFKPVFIDGSTIQKATLCNEDFYTKMNIAVGDEVIVHKAAAIIPQILRVLERSSDRKVIPFPDKCPCCGTFLVKHNEEHTDMYCDNDDCKSRVIDKIVNYTHAIECDGFADAIVEKLHDAGYLSSILDLYTLKNHKSEIASLDRMSLKVVEKLCNNIEASKTADLWKILAGLGIPNIGSKMAKVLVKKFKSIKALMNADKAKLEDVEGVSSITADCILKWFAKHRELVDGLESAGVKLTESKSEKASSKLSGKTFCITGALSRPRQKYVELIERSGGSIMNGVTKKTSYLITNDKMSGSSKNKAAAQLGIPVITEDEFLEMCSVKEV